MSQGGQEREREGDEAVPKKAIPTAGEVCGLELCSSSRAESVESGAILGTRVLELFCAAFGLFCAVSGPLHGSSFL